MRILAISGSLRAASSNTILLNAAAALAPENVEVVVYRGLGDLPHFNPHLDKGPVPPAVTDFRTQLGKSSGVIISSPEYAHGVPGVLKNGLDWLVASGELYVTNPWRFSVPRRLQHCAGISNRNPQSNDSKAGRRGLHYCATTGQEL